jgi:integrase
MAAPALLDWTLDDSLFGRKGGVPGVSARATIWRIYQASTGNAPGFFWGIFGEILRSTSVHRHRQLVPSSIRLIEVSPPCFRCCEAGSGTGQTVWARRAALRRLLAWMSWHRPYVKWLQAVAKDDAMAYWEAMETRGLAANTRDHRLSYLRTWWEYLRHPADLRKNVWHRIEWLNEEGEPYLPFGVDQIQQLIVKGAGIDSGFGPGFWAGVIRVAFYTGLRETDTLRLNENQIRRDQGYVRIVPAKTEKYQIQAVHPIDAPWLQRLPEPDEDGYFWPVAARMIGKGRTNEYGAFRKEWQQLIGLIGPETTRAPKPGEQRVRDVVLYTFHSLRHTCVTAARDQGADPRDVQTMVGHSNVRMTEHYDHSDAWFGTSSKPPAASTPSCLGCRERRRRKIRLYSFHSLRHAFATMAPETGAITEKDPVAPGNWAGEEVIKGHYDHRDKLRLAMKAADKVAAALPKW